MRALGWALLILALTLMPPPEVPGQGWMGRYHVDKLVHAVLFGTQVLLLVPVLSACKHSLCWAVVVAIGYGGLTELLQGLLMTGRSADPLDFLANSAGAFLAAVWWQRGMASATHARDR